MTTMLDQYIAEGRLIRNAWTGTDVRAAALGAALIAAFVVAVICAAGTSADCEAHGGRYLCETRYSCACYQVRP